METALTSETTERKFADITLATALDTETAERIANDATLETAIGTETARAQAAEAEKEDLANKSTDITTDGESDIKYTSAKAVKDYVDASASGNQTALNEEINRATAAEGVLEAAIATETIRAEGAENQLSADLASESSARQAADTNLDLAITAEADRAEAAEAGIVADLATESSERQAADTALETAIATETSRAEGAEATIIADLTSETTERTANDATLETAIGTETARAQAAEAEKENLANKSTDITTDGESDIKYTSAKAVKDYVNLQLNPVLIKTAAIIGGAGLNADGSYSASSSANYIAGVSSLSQADQVLDVIIKENKDLINLKAPLASPALSGTPTAPTAEAGTNTTQIATTEFVTAANAINASGISGLETVIYDGIAAQTLSIGDFVEGGVVFWVDPSDNTKGLVCAVEDQSTGIQWYNGSNITTGATGTEIGTGAGNTIAIIAAQGATEINYAAGLARAYNGGGFTDWFLPSKEEIFEMVQNRGIINATAGANGGSNFSDGSTSYWSSTESGSNAWAVFFGNAHQSVFGKADARRVRAVRAISKSATSSLTAITAEQAAQNTAIDLKANIASPTFTGTPTLPTGTIAVTQTAGNNTTAVATTEFVTTAITRVDAAGLVSITEGENTGYRRADADAANYGDIGLGAVDLSLSDGPHSEYGATGYASVAMGEYTISSEYGSTAMGASTTASAFGSTAMGRDTNASGYTSTAMGRSTIASGYSSTAMGVSTTASAPVSVAMGYFTTASDYGSLVLGQYNNTGSVATSATAFSTSAPALVIGNGTSSTDKNDAFVVDFSGNVTASGTLTAGDVTYTGTDGTTGQILTTDGSGNTSWVAPAAAIREVADEFSATTSQTSFTLTQAPSVNSKVKMYVNGIRISNTAYSISGSTLTYMAANNGNYALTTGDRIQCDYYY
ncbi:Lcl domain-containing protein [Cyclobacterium jeungdonense]|uniref:DUF1566 domain-containing protein n=1 Tax=Cyclobacterium jeungdonense TaxID=708087 RepID=A0ABT8CBX5_9BACT|nr:DUF1566 domain-containing protein [Cyclobacterium jeungdonense]MDN3689897.1 DUF1566 domain-containing protein [Cyclobacterium jeungdonense]